MTLDTITLCISFRKCIFLLKTHQKLQTFELVVSSLTSKGCYIGQVKCCVHNCLFVFFIFLLYLAVFLVILQCNMSLVFLKVWEHWNCLRVLNNSKKSKLWLQHLGRLVTLMLVTHILEHLVFLSNNKKQKHKLI